MASNLSESVEQLATDLFNLEVSTVLKPGITARKMPDPATALGDIAAKCVRYLREHAKLTGVKLRGGGAPGQEWLKWEARKVNSDTFKQIRDLAVDLLRHRTTDDGVNVILARIIGNCERILELFTDLKKRDVDVDGKGHDGNSLAQQNKFKLGPREIVVVRKIWELGVEEVVLKTVVQLDGDVVTRIKSGFETDSNLHAIHFESLSKSFTHWQFLVRTLSDFVSKFGSWIFR